eukprot:1368537-Pleurochrysis_carterae.AAC.1
MNGRTCHSLCPVGILREQYVVQVLRLRLACKPIEAGPVLTFKDKEDDGNVAGETTLLFVKWDHFSLPAVLTPGLRWNGKRPC